MLLFYVELCFGFLTGIRKANGGEGTGTHEIKRRN